MARHTTTRWNYSTGERGRNRVRVFEHSSGILMLEFRKNGKRTRTSLGHRDRDRAKREADQAAAKLAEVEEGLLEPEHQEEPPEELTLHKLFEIYGEEVTPEKGERTRKHDKAASKMFERYFGADRNPATLNLVDWERFIRDRQTGRIGPGEPPWKAVSARTVERDLRFLLAVMNWATMAGDGQGGVLLERNPLKGYKAPKEKNPLRVKLSDEEYKALLAVAKSVDWRFYVALVLAHETGHRIGAIRQLRWSDIDLEEQCIRWRAETEKTGYAHVTPMTDTALEVIQFARSMNPSIGGAPVMPSPEKPTECMSRYLARDWWKRAEKEAELERKRGRGWHSLRRKFASDLKEVPLKTLQQLGGWKTHMTILMCYQQVDEGEMRDALQRRPTGT